MGIIPASFFKEGNVGVVSRSGTLTYQIGNEIARAGFGNSSIVGIGGDPVPGSSFVDVIELFQADPETELIVLAGEIGGSAEEEAADYIAEHVDQAGGRLHRRLHGAGGQADGPRGSDRVGQLGHRGRQGAGAGGARECALDAPPPRSPSWLCRSCAADPAQLTSSAQALDLSNEPQHAAQGSCKRRSRPSRMEVDRFLDTDDRHLCQRTEHAWWRRAGRDPAGR